MDMALILTTIRAMPDCVVHPPVGLPTVEDGHILPYDVVQFYQLCGGADLFMNEGYSVSVVSALQVVKANPIIFSGIDTAQLEATKRDISWSWYIIAKGGDGEYITIDFSRERLGHCYDSFWDIHPGNSPIIAISFTDLLTRLLSSQGKAWYWSEPEFKSLGRPYD